MVRRDVPGLDGRGAPWLGALRVLLRALRACPRGLYEALGGLGHRGRARGQPDAVRVRTRYGSERGTGPNAVRVRTRPRRSPVGRPTRATRPETPAACCRKNSAANCSE